LATSDAFVRTLFRPRLVLQLARAGRRSFCYSDAPSRLQLEAAAMNQRGTTMKRQNRKTGTATLSRRRMLQALAAAGITGPLAVELVAQSRTTISADTLRRASAIVGEEFSAERLASVEKALQRNLDQFQAVRDLVIGDPVEPAPVFAAKTSMAASTGSAPRR
jgi:hypothetical protein